MKLQEEKDLIYQIDTGTLKFPAVTTEKLAGYKIVKIIGPVYGLTVRTRGIGGQWLASLEVITGGEITAFVSECMKARNESLARLILNSKKVGANAVIRIDFETSGVEMTLFSAYGTAVVAEKIE